MKKLSTGQDATLGNYRKMAAIFFGVSSKAIQWLDDKIAEQGEDEEVIADEGQVLQVLFEMNKHE